MFGSVSSSQHEQERLLVRGRIFCIFWEKLHELFKENAQLRKDCLRLRWKWTEKLGSSHTVEITKGTMCHAKFGRKSVRRRKSFNSSNIRREVRGVQISRKERKTKPWNRFGAPAETHGTWQRMSFNSKRRQRYVLLSCRSLANAGTIFEKARRATVRNRLRSVHAHAEQEGNSSKIHEHHNGGNGQWRSAEKRSNILCARSSVLRDCAVAQRHW